MGLRKHLASAAELKGISAEAAAFGYDLACLSFMQPQQRHPAFGRVY